MNIIVTGSLGNVGKPLATELVRKGHTVTVISHRAEKQQAIKDLGATAAIGSVQDVNFLVSVFTGADAVFAMVPPSFAVPDLIAHSREIGRTYAEALQESGVKRVVFLSSWGAHLDKGTGAIVGTHDVEEMLNKLSGVAVTHLRACSFYTNFYGFVDMIKSQGFMGANYGGDDKIVLVAPSDIAAAAAEELVTPATGTNVRYVASDEHTCTEAARILGTAIGKPDLTWITFTKAQMQSNLEQTGMPASIVSALVDLYDSIHTGALGQDYERHKPAVMGKVKLEEFAKEFAAAF